MSEIKDRWLNMRVTEKEKKQIQRDASKEGRSVSNYLFWLHEKNAKKRKFARGVAQ